MFRIVLSKALQTAGVAILVVSLSACDNLFGSDDEEDGTVTVAFSDDSNSAEEGNYLSAAVLPEGEEFPSQDAEVLGGVIGLEIQNGAASDSLKEWDAANNQPTTDDMTFSAGDTVDFYAWTNTGSPGSPEPPYHEISFTVDGDRTIEVSAEDFAE